MLALQVTEGNNSGARITLPTGTYTIGSAHDADIVLSDPKVAPQHCKIFIDSANSGQVEVLHHLKMNNTSYRDGIHLTEFNPPISFTLGATSFLVGPENQKLAASVEDQKKQKKKKQQHKPSNRFSFSSLRQIELSSLPLPFLLASAFATGLLSLFLLQGLLKQLGLGKDDSNKQQESLQEIIAFTADTPVVLKIAEGQANLSGYLIDENKRQRMARAINGLNLRELDVDVWPIKEIEERVKQLLLGAGFREAKVGLSDSGVLKISGFLGEEDKWNQVESRIRNDIRGIKKIDDSEVIPARKATSEINALLAKNELYPHVNCKYQNDELVVNGRLPSSQLKSWNSFIRGVETLFPSKPNLKIDVVQMDMKTFLESILGIRYRKHSPTQGWLETEDGHRCYAGTAFPSGYSIIEIKDNAIVLGYGESFRYTVPFQKEPTQ